MNEKIRLGIIGCGSIASKRHLPGLANLKKAGLDNFEVTAVCDAVEQNLHAAVVYVRDHLGSEPASHRSWKDLVAGGKVDAVDICLPHGLHHVVGVACLEAGMHVLIEKPLAVSLKTGRLLVDAAERTGRMLSAAVPLRRLQGQCAVHWALNEARLIGEVRTFFHNYTHWRPPVPAALTDGMRWRRDRAMGGGSTVTDSGIHFLDTLRYFHGDIEQVYAEVRAYRDGEPVVAREEIAQHRENSVMAILTFKSGVAGTWCWSTVAAGAETRNCVIHGSEGSIEDTNYADSSIVCHLFKGGAELRRRDGSYMSMHELQSKHRAALGADGMQRLFPNGVTDEFALTIWDFLSAIEIGGRPEADGRDGLATLAVAEAIYESSWCGQAVNVASLLNGETPSRWQSDIDAYWDEYGMLAPGKTSATVGAVRG
ncbi:MAG: Gfo/Idh/MocA family oxidoreductase [Chloroflexi bacterium]|nr:Gfo/Idh/MocA family oxidoreductase [Chloroflexota bacterium]